MADASEAKVGTAVAVIGAGIVGAAIGYHLARRGAAVTFLDRAGPASQATAKSFAWINASYGNPEPYFRLRYQSLLEFRHLDAELGGALAVKWGGSLLWGVEDLDLEAYIAGHRAWGYAIRVVGPEEFRRLEPRFAEPPPLAVFAEHEGSLAPVEATRALLAAAERHGARLLTDSKVGEIRARGGRVTGLETSRGPVEADHVVLAAGTGSESLAAGLGVPLPMQNLPGLLIRTRPVEPVLNRLVLGPKAHMKQDPDGRILVGESFGGDNEADDPEALGAAILARLKDCLPGISGLEIEEVLVGLRPIPADGFPVVGAAPGAPGLYLAVMHSGVTLAPIVGRLAAEEILGGARIGLLSPYRPERFAAVQAGGPGNN